MGWPTCERVRVEGRVRAEAGGGVSEQVREGRGDGGERRLPPPLQHLWILVLPERKQTFGPGVGAIQRGVYSLIRCSSEELRVSVSSFMIIYDLQ